MSVAVRIAGGLRSDLRLQYRYGFYVVGVLVSAIMIGVLRWMPPDTARTLLPVFLFVNGIITTYFFVAGLVLYEKREGVLEALVVTPLRAREYLAVRVATLTGLATLETVGIVLLGWGADFRIAPVVLGVVLLGVLWTLIGMLVIFRYDSINEYLLPAALLQVVFQLPMFSVFGIWDAWYFWLWPTKGPLLLVLAGFEPVATGPLLVSLALSLAWIAGLAVWVQGAFARFIVRREGT